MTAWIQVVGMCVEHPVVRDSKLRAGLGAVFTLFLCKIIVVEEDLHQGEM